MPCRNDFLIDKNLISLTFHEVVGAVDMLVCDTLANKASKLMIDNFY